MTRPIIGITCCVKQVENHAFHVAGDKYVRAASEASAGLPLLIPALGDGLDPADLVGRLDGLLVTGSLSNVEPVHYGGGPTPADDYTDAERDRTTLPLIRAALTARLPLLAICRGIQELNVALGGTLHAKVHEVTGRQDHRASEDQPQEVQYGPSHAVRLASDGALAALFGAQETMVNSLHGQGIDRPAAGLTVVAEAPDGQIEAVRVTGVQGVDGGFALGVQWHPEWRALENPDSRSLFKAFGEACASRARRRIARTAA